MKNLLPSFTEYPQVLTEYPRKPTVYGIDFLGELEIHTLIKKQYHENKKTCTPVCVHFRTKLVSQRLGSGIEGASKVECSISVYRHPRLKPSLNTTSDINHSASLVTIFANTIELKAYE